jgi:predicted enzyme related to lactoylglutathione lyase
MKNKSPVVHFEIGYDDRKRVTDFYEKVFGWGIEMLGPEMGNYIIATTTETDRKTGRPKKPGAINGGFYQKTDDPLSHPPSFVIAVSDIRQAMKDVETGGGKILGAMDESRKHTDEPMMIPGVGLWISAMDTEGNRFSLLQPILM